MLIPEKQYTKKKNKQTISIIDSYFPQKSHVKFETFIYWKLIATSNEEKNHWSEKEARKPKGEKNQ